MRPSLRRPNFSTLLKVKGLLERRRHSVVSLDWTMTVIWMELETGVTIMSICWPQAKTSVDAHTQNNNSRHTYTDVFTNVAPRKPMQLTPEMDIYRLNWIFSLHINDLKDLFTRPVDDRYMENNCWKICEGFDSWINEIEYN